MQPRPAAKLTTGHRDVNALRPGEQAVEVEDGFVTQMSCRAGHEERRGLPREVRRRCVPVEVDALVHPVQPPRGDPTRYAG